MNHVTEEIAATAARMVVEEGLEFGPAKRRAIKQLGLPKNTSLPDNDLLEEAVREYIEIFCPETQAAELQALRELAQVWMTRLAEFRPHLGGSVLGFAGEEVDALSVLCPCPPLSQQVVVHLMIYDFDDLRGALKADAKGRTPRGDLAALKRILETNNGK